MLFNLLFPLADQFSMFNLFRYLTFRTGGAVLTALVISFVVGPALIRWLREQQGEGQPIRADGPPSHLLRKRGTPTMGGTLILLALTLATLLWADLSNGYVWVVLLITLGFGGVGLVDDWTKLTQRSSKGMSGRLKLLLQSLIALMAAVAIAFLTGMPLGTGLTIPFFKDVLVPLHVLFFPFAALVMVGASNAVNLTDGLDGLAIVPAMIAASCFALIAYLVGNAIFANYLGIPFVSGSGELAVFCGAMVGRVAGLSLVQRAAGDGLHGRYRLARRGRRAGCGGRGHQARAGAGRDRRPVRAGDRVGDGSGRLVQADRQARVSDGTAASSFRAEGLGGADHRDSILDHCHDFGPDRAGHPQAALSGAMLRVPSMRDRTAAVLGLGRSGLAACRALAASGARVWAWDDDGKRRRGGGGRCRDRRSGVVRLGPGRPAGAEPGHPPHVSAVPTLWSSRLAQRACPSSATLSCWRRINQNGGSSGSPAPMASPPPRR